MPTYRCYFMDCADHIKSVELIEATDDRTATEAARAMLRAQSRHQRIEVWDGAKLVHRAEEARPIEPA
jgi:hypothetical protein